MNSAIIITNSMDAIRQSIIERRDRLGWNNKTLAEKSNVPLIVIQKFLKGGFCLRGYISQINSSLNLALHLNTPIEESQNTDTGRDIPKTIRLLIRERRKLLQWTTHELAAKANIPFKRLLNIEKGTCCWPEDLIRLEQILGITLVERGEEKYQSNYFIDTSDINLKIYFPNLSRGEERMLFGYSKRDGENKIKLASFKQDRKEGITETKKIIYPKISYRHIESNERLSAILEYEKTLSFPQKIKNYPKNKFTPNFNPVACVWFERFDTMNNTTGFYATTKGEYYIEDLGYFPDYFNAELKLIMEWDEPYHYNNDEELSAKDKERQKKIQKYFPDFKFIRIKEEDFKEYLD